MKRVDRNKILVRHIVSLGLAASQKDLGVKMGYENESYFSQIINEKVETPKDFILKLKNILPNLSEVWLLTGNGEMLVAEQGVAQIVTTASRIEQTAIVRENEEVEVDIEGLMLDTNTAPKDIAQIIGEDIEYLRRCNNKLFPRHIMRLQDRFGDALIDKYAKFSNAIEAEIIESFPVLPEEVTTSPNTDILKYVEENGSELETINPSQLLNDAKVDVAERIKRTSMLPTFQPEDTVFIRFIKDKMKIVDGETYYLDCKNRPTMIRLVKFEPDGKLRLIAKNSQYGDIVIERTDIINIGVVVALFRMTFGDQYSELEALRREKEAERDRKDSQIDKMLEMMEKRDEQQSKLIDFITKDK
jgi:hypothetical protein